MPVLCSKCNASNPSQARFCQACGNTMGATQVQGRTMVAPTVPGIPDAPAFDVKTIVANAQAALGPTIVNPSSLPQWTRQQREHTACVMDVSGSMSECYDARYTKLDAAKRAYTSMLLQKERIDPLDEVGIVEFSDAAMIRCPLLQIATNKRDILLALQSLSIHGGTDINEGLKAARELFDWSQNGVVRRIVLLTDGQGGNPLRTAEDLKSRGVVIDVLGVGDGPFNVDERLLRKVASVIEGENRYRFLKDQQTLVSHCTVLGNKTVIDR